VVSRSPCFANDGDVHVTREMISTAGGPGHGQIAAEVVVDQRDTPAQGAMRGVKFLSTVDAARLLDVQPNTLRAWEQRYGFPSPHTSRRGRRRFDVDEIAVLREALDSRREIAAAIAQAKMTLLQR
jgi:MerR HTH family regulatory protein